MRKRGFFNSLTFWHYSGFGVKLSPIFGFAKYPKYKTNFQLSKMPKSVVVAVMRSVFYLVASNSNSPSFAFFNDV
jgi:hypothetical protein